ncbi:MAG: chemotaxis protein CheA [Leptospiraceae bacterium]|nr:chemotaxis protein CheA [Leptospiraceae bacterium]MCK6382041.1 chemotaxis protein CheA [Leptospiraceae bacterium]NUM40806.1 chemotaxis protein CheA [Leptospiraceae bacterium]
MDEFLKDFLKDTQEDLSKIESILVHLEEKVLNSEELDYDVINSLFRHFHSIKGSSGFFGMKELVRVAHQAESILDLYRKKKLKIEPESIESLFRVHDFLKELISIIDSTGKDKGLENTADLLIEELKNIETANPVFPSESEKETKPKKFEIFTDVKNLQTEEIENQEENREKASNSSNEENTSREETKSSTKESDAKKFEIFKEEIQQTPQANLETEVLKETPNQKSTDTKELKTEDHQEASDIRIPTSKLDLLVNLLGELVIVDAMVSRHANDEILNIEMLRRSASQLSKITHDLQEIGLSMRMVPISGLFQKMHRLVRDVSKKSGKNVRLEVKGEETEIDKSIIEKLSDPLVHIIRNAVDHGIETEAERVKNSKPPLGLITLEAMHRGNEIWIIISDNGKGLNREKILNKAIENEILTTDPNSLSDFEVWELIFLPGFSTADSVTDISGRGVGMDVVKKEITKLKGKIDVHSVYREGSTFYLRIPLTLAIIDAMVVQFRGRYYIIPTENIERFIDLTSLTVSEIHDHQEVMKLNNRLISVVELTEVFQYENSLEKSEDRIAVVVGKKENFVAIKLDKIIGSQQVVVKPLDETMESLQGLTGSAILGDGQVGVIIDTEYIVQMYARNFEESVMS